MVGNGVTNWKYDGDPAYVEMGMYYGLYGYELWELMKQENCHYYYIDVASPNDTDECLAYYDIFNKLV